MTSPAPSILLDYPTRAALGRPLPKTKLLEHGEVNARVKQLLVTQIERIIWAYKLAPGTLHLAARPDVPEIQIFHLRLKVPDLHHDVLRCIDDAIPFPLLFELTFENETREVAAYKRTNESGGRRWVVSDYFQTEWLPADSPRAAMPMALHLGSLYERLLQRLIPLSARPQESLADLVARTAHAQAKERELDKATARLAKEKQFNRKVEINAIVRQLNAELRELTQ